MTIIAFILLAAVFADGLRAGSGLPEWVAIGVAAVGAGVPVFGSPVAYYRHQSVRAMHGG